MEGFQRGAVAMIDALGFRGIWGNDPRKPSLEVFATLKAVKTAVQAEIATLRKTIKPRTFPDLYQNLVREPSYEFRFLSDTLILAASVRPRKRDPRKAAELAARNETGLDLPQRNAVVDGFMRYLVCQCTCAAIQAAAAATKPIAYRGVVSAGHFAIEDNFILGPAVDEAAGLMDSADAALVWLAPSAAKLPHGLVPIGGDRWADMVSLQDIPLKDGRTLRGKVIDPFALVTPTAAKLLRQATLKTMNSDRLEVVLKRQNTKKFFDALDTHRQAVAWKKAAAAKREAKTSSAAFSRLAASASDTPTSKPLIAR